VTRLAPEDCFLNPKTETFIDNFVSMVTTARKMVRRPILNQEERKNTPEDQEKINGWMEILGRHPDTKALLDEALDSGTKIYGDNTIKPLGYYSPAENILVVNPDRTDGEVVATMIHELTHRHQDKLGYGLSPMLSPRDLILMLFNMEANAEANAVAESFKLAQAGFPDALEAHLRTGYGDISRAFLDKIKENPENAHNGVATRAAHDQWFEQPWRRKAYGEQAIGIVINNIKVFASVFVTQGFTPLTPETIAGMAEDPNGDNYLKTTLETGDSLTGDRYRKGLTAEIEMALAAIDKALNDLKNKLDGKGPETDDTRKALLPDSKNDALENAVRKFAGRMVLSDKKVNGLHLPIPTKADRYRTPRKGPVPMPVF